MFLVDRGNFGNIILCLMEKEKVRDCLIFMGIIFENVVEWFGILWEK